MNNSTTVKQTTPWNKGRILGQKPALKLKEIWEIRIRLQMENNIHELALFNMAIDSKLRYCQLIHIDVKITPLHKYQTQETSVQRLNAQSRNAL